jgi:GntR family transcriptional regulator, transcriptional repressor for pyruvate dehydrogenase complex
MHRLRALMAAKTRASAPVQDAERAPASSELVARELRRQVQAQGLRPGDRIGTEQGLATQFGVSRPTLREALRLLASSHLIRASQGRGGGIFVASTPNEGMGRNVSDSIASMLATESVSLQELLDARMFLEVPLAGLAARNATPETIVALEQAIADAQAGELGDEVFNAADSRFHKTIAAAAGNDLLVAFTRWINDVLLPSLIDYIGPSLSGEDILAQHRAILQAIRRRQPAAAERAMRAHLEHLMAVKRELDSRRGEAT